jgi:hypothetical protein
MIKKVYVLLFVFSSLSCSDNESDSVELSSEFVGTYELTEFIFDNGLAVDLDVDGEFESTGLIDYINCSSRLTLENNGSYSFQKIIINQPIEVDDNNEITLPVQLFPVECEIFNEFGTWSEGGVSGEIISINSEANQQTGFNEFLTVEDINTIINSNKLNK